jgi:hypothetical protein
MPTGSQSDTHYVLSVINSQLGEYVLCIICNDLQNITQKTKELK